MKRNRPIRCGARLIVALTVCVFQCGLARGEEPSQAPLNVVLLNSGDLFAPGAVRQNDALREALTAGTERPVNFCIETYSQNLSAIGFDSEFTSFMRRKYQGQKIDLIITAGTAALNFLERHRPELWPEAPAMFYSVDEASNRQRKFSPGMTGLMLKFNPAGTLDFAVQLQPNARRVVVVTGVSEFDHSWLPDIQSHLQNRHPTLNATFLTNQTVAELTEELGRLPADSIVLFTTVIADASGTRYVSRDVSARLGAVSGAPLYALYDIMLDHGIAGGVITSLEDHGRRAGELALRLIAGEKPDAIPVLPAAPAVPTVDWRQLQRWNISEDRLPPGSIVLFRPTTLWGQYHNSIIIGLCITVAQSATIVALLAQRRRRRRAEATVHEDEKRMALTAEAANLGIWIRDLVRNEIWATDSWRSLLGFTRSETLHLNGILQRVHPEDREALSRTLTRAVESEGHYETEYRVVLPDGRTHWIASRGRVELNGAGQPVLVRGVSMDITARKQAEAETLRQRAELAHVARVSTLGELAASVAHELNQPLGAILANAEAADLFLNQDPPALDELRAILVDIRKDDERASEVILRMRSLLRKHELERQPLEINSVVEDVLQLVSGDAALRKIALSADLAPVLPKILGDRVHLQQVLLNLILNGMDAMAAEPRERRRLSVRTRSISNGVVELAVIDSGHGIAPDKLTRLFEPFFTTKTNGMGMGLSISRTIIEAHRGKISAENNVSGGATFRVTLRFALEDAKS